MNSGIVSDRRPTQRSRPSPSSSSPVAGVLQEYLLVALGCFVVAASFQLFLNGNGVACGGLTGLSTLMQRRFGLEPALTQAAVNAPLLLLAIWRIGRRFSVKTVAGAALLPLCVLLTRHWHVVTDNLLLAAIYGGIGTGAGLGLIFRGGGSVGGTSLGAQLLSRLFSIRPGVGLLLLDGCIIGASGLLLGPERAMYGMIGLFASKRTIDVVLNGLATSRLVWIIAREPEAVEVIRRGVIEEMDRGLTVLHGTGGFTGQDRPVLMVVVNPNEVARLKALVHAADPGAFVILADAAEVLGEGFQRYTL